MKKAYILPLIGILFLGVDAFGAPSLVSLGKNDTQTRAISRAGSLRIGGLVQKKGVNTTRTVKSLDGATENSNVARASSTTRLGVGRYLGVPHGQSVSMGALPNELMNRLSDMDNQISDMSDQIAQKQDALDTESSQYLHFTDTENRVLDVDDEALLSALRSGHNIVIRYESGRGIVWYYEDDTENVEVIPIADLREDVLSGTDMQNDVLTPISALQGDISDLQNGKMDKVSEDDIGKILVAGAGGGAVAGYTLEELATAVADILNQ